MFRIETTCETELRRAAPSFHRTSACTRIHVQQAALSILVLRLAWRTLQDGKTALMYAAENGCAQCITELLQHATRLNKDDPLVNTEDKVRARAVTRGWRCNPRQYLLGHLAAGPARRLPLIGTHKCYEPGVVCRCHAT